MSQIEKGMSGGAMQVYRKEGVMDPNPPEITLEGDELRGNTSRVARQTDEEPDWVRMKEQYNHQADRQR